MNVGLVAAALAGTPSPDALRLQAPFDGEHLPASLFDHGAGSDGQVAFDGRRVWGRPGHRAYDFAMPVGTPIRAAADGVVVEAGDVGPVRCWGTTRVERSLVVRLRHDGGYETVHMHLSRVLVRAGQAVRAGEGIGLSGNTGCSRGPHLHFQVERAGAPVDPYALGLWGDGRAPALRRTGRTPGGAGDLRIVELVGTDLLDPLGEAVRLGVPATAAGRVPLRGYQLENAVGDRVPLPEVSLAPGETLLVWIQRAGSDVPGEVGLGRAALIDDLGDCVVLVDPSGNGVSWAPFGTVDAEARCRRPEVADVDATE